MSQITATRLIQASASKANPGAAQAAGGEERGPVFDDCFVHGHCTRTRKESKHNRLERFFPPHALYKCIGQTANHTKTQSDERNRLVGNAGKAEVHKGGIHLSALQNSNAEVNDNGGDARVSDKLSVHPCNLPRHAI